MSSHEFRKRFTILCLTLLVHQLASAQVLSPAEQIINQARLLEARIPSLSFPENEAKLYADGLKRAAARNDRVLLSLYLLQPLQVAIMTSDYHQSKAEVIKAGKEAFENEWKTLGEQLTLKEQTFKSQPVHIPAAVLALAEASLTQVHPYHQSGRLYALTRSIDEGMYYLGRAPASLEFCSVLPATAVRQTSR